MKLEIREKWNALCQTGVNPKERAKLINTVLPKDTQYGDTVTFSKPILEKFRNVYDNWRQCVLIAGKTRTRMLAELGHGNRQLGEDLLKGGLRINDFVERDGMIYELSNEDKRERGEDNANLLQAQGSANEGATLEHISPVMEHEESATFALADERQEPMPDGQTEYTTPATAEWLQHVKHAKQHVVSFVHTIRETAT